MTTKTSEQYALEILRGHRKSMTRPDFQQIADDSALFVHDVKALWEQLLAGKWDSYRAPGRVQPAATAPRPASADRPAEVQPDADAWRAAVNHSTVRVRRAAERAVAAVAAVEELLAAEAGKEELRKKEAKLAAQLAAVRAELRGKPVKAPATGGVERIQCECGDTVRKDRVKQHINRSAKHAA